MKFVYINMDQQNKTAQDEHLDFIVSALHRKKKKNDQIKDDATIRKLYETMTNVVSGLDDSINQCKKYNEAKIHRKYEIILNDQRKRIQFLQQKIKQQHKARSPSKKYVEDLLDKLISYKFQNQSLSRKNNQLMLQNQELKKKLQIYEQNEPTKQKQKQQQNKEKIQIKQNPSSDNISAEAVSSSIKTEIISYLKLKQQLRKHQTQQKTKFQRFLRKIKDKVHLWSIRQFLQSIDKWSVDYLNDPTSILESQQIMEQALPKPVNKNNSTLSYNNNSIVINRSLNNKNIIRTRKTNSFRQFYSNNSFNNNVLR